MRKAAVLVLAVLWVVAAAPVAGEVYNPVAAAILERCTGETTVSAIVDDLSTTYVATRARILADVPALLGSLLEKRLLEV